MNCVLDAHCAYHGTILAWHSAGQVSGMIQSVEGAADIVQRLVLESAEVLNRLGTG